MLGAPRAKSCSRRPSLWRGRDSLDFSADGRWLCTRVNGDAIVWDAALRSRALLLQAAGPGNDQGPFGGLGDRGSIATARSSPRPAKPSTATWSSSSTMPSTADPSARCELEGIGSIQLCSALTAEESPPAFTTKCKAACRGATVMIWEAATGDLIRTFESRGDGALPSFSPDGSCIRTRGWTRPNREIGHRIYCWDIETGKKSATEQAAATSRTGRFLHQLGRGQVFPARRANGRSDSRD